MDNAPRPLRDVLADAHGATLFATRISQEARAEADCERLGLTNAVVVPDIVAHDRAVREARDAELRQRIRKAVAEPCRICSCCQHGPLDADRTEEVIDDILGPAPHTARRRMREIS